MKTNFYKLRIALIGVLLAVVVCSLCGLALYDVAFAEQSAVTSVEYNAYEVIVRGEQPAFVAKVTRGDTVSDEFIKYTDFSAIAATKLFDSFTAKGYVDGWDKEITQTIIVMPEDVRYMVNFGGNSTNSEYIAPGEGILGLEFDHTGDSGVNEPYFKAILRRFPDIVNKTSAKQYGQNTDLYGDWGYVGDQFVGTAKTTVKEKDLYEKILFPKRGTDDVEMKFALGKGQYDVYIGTYSYWFSRPCDIVVNGVTVEEGYQLMPSKQVYKTSINNQQEVLSLTLEGGGLYDEAMVSFVCITASDAREYEELNMPQSDDSIDMSRTAFTVGGLAEGATLVAYDYDTGNWLYTQTVGVGQSSLEVTLEDWQLTTSLSRIALMQLNKQFQSAVAVVQRTDISDMSVTFVDEYTSTDVVCGVSGNALSGIVRLTVKNVEGIVVDKIVDAVANYADDFAIQCNGTYDVVLTSGSGATSTQTINVTKIDKELPSTKLSLDLQSAKQSNVSKLVLKLDVNTLAPTSTIVCVDQNGKTDNATIDANKVTFSQSGYYTLTMQNSLGKKASTNVMVALAQQDIKTVSLSQRKSGRASEVSMLPANGYDVTAVVVYATTDDGTEKMIVNGADGKFAFNVYGNGTYFVETTTSDGSIEVFVLGVTDFGNNKAEKLAVADIAGIALLSASVVLTIVCVGWVVVKYKRNVKSSK